MTTALRNLLTVTPHSHEVNLGLLILRVWFGASAVALHGWNKLANFSAMAARFDDVLGLGSPEANLVLVVFAEVFAASALAAGFLTRPAALILVTNFTVAFFAGHGARLSGQGNGELAFLFLAASTTLLVTGPGRYALDAVLFPPRRGRDASRHREEP